MKRPIIFLLIFALMFVSFQSFNKVNSKCLASAENEFEIESKAGLLMDCDTGKIIFEKNKDERLPIASMTKLASLSVIFDAINKDAIKPSDMVMVSENAASVGGSSAFLDAGSSYKVSELIKSVIIASANDSTVALAEHVAGSEDLFVSKMNKLASELNLQNTHFENSTGLPCKEHYSSASDIAKIYKTVCGNELYQKYAKVWMEDFIHPSGRKTGLVNTNRLVKTFDGIEGGKTGYTDEAKYCLTASAKRGETRLIGVVIGSQNSKTRFAEMTKLLSFGFAAYETKTIVNSILPVTILKVAKSKQAVKVYPKNDLKMFNKKDVNGIFSTDFKIDENITAPLKKGDVVGKLFVFDENNMVVDEVELEVRENVEKEKLKDFVKKLINVW